MDGVAEYDGDRSPDGVAWRYWKRFVKKGYMPDHVDVEIEYALFQLSADLSVFLHWFYSASELVRFATKGSLLTKISPNQFFEKAKVKQKSPHMRAKQAENRGKKQNSIRKGLARRKDNALLGHRSRALMRSLIKTREKQ